MKLEYIVPISDFQYIGENVSLNSMWGDNKFHEKIKNFDFDGILLKRVESNDIDFLDDIDVLSDSDKREIRGCYWAFYFKCEEEMYDSFVGKINLLLLSFRIHKKSDISVKYFLCKNDSSESERYSEDWKYALADIKNHSELNIEDLDVIKGGVQLLENFEKTSFRTSHAVNFLFLGYTSYYWMEAFILFVTSLETLVSPSTENQVTNRIIKRTVKLIDDNTICSRTKLDDLYKLRSNITHGRILVGIDFKDHKTDLQDLQKIVLSAFKTILSKNFNSIYKNEKSKELFFEVNTQISENIKALIFDCDGTLVDSMPLHMKAWEEAFKFFDAKYDYEFLYSLKGMKEIEIIKLYNNTFGTNINPEEIVSKKHNYYFKNIDSVKPIEPIVEIAKEYFGKLPLAVVSGSVRDIVHKELEVTGIFHLFKIILTADDPYKPKPAPDIFLVAAKSLNVSPEHCLVFEDGDPGLVAAANAGMKTVDVREYI